MAFVGTSAPSLFVSFNRRWRSVARLCIYFTSWIAVHLLGSPGSKASVYWTVSSNTCQNAPIFTKTPPLFIKTPPLFYQNASTIFQNKSYCQNDTFNKFFLLKRRYMYHVWRLAIQDLSSKFIYCICVHAYLTSDDNELVYTFVHSGNSVYKYIKLTYILGKV
jgi:hypothetical protein